VDLEKKVSCLAESVVNLSRNPELIDETLKYNELHVDVHLMDEKWPQLSKDSREVKERTGTPVAEVLRKFIQLVSLSGEGFIIGFNGGLVAATNKTTDFWQGDEKQFYEGMSLNENETKIYRAQPDYSAEKVILKITTPIYSKKENRNIGVLVAGFNAIVLDFIKPCQ